MPSLQDRLNALRGEPPEAVASILGAALAHAEPPERQAICTALLATGHPTPTPSAVAAIIDCLHQLGPPAMEMVRQAPVPLGPAVRIVLRRGRRQAILNTIDLAGQRADAELLTDLADLLGSPLDGVAKRAAEAMLAVVAAHAGSDGRRRLEPAIARHIDTAVASAVSSYHKHRLADVLLAAAVLAARPGPKLAAVLCQPDHPAMFALRRVAGRTDHPLVPGNLLRWLTVEALSGQVARWMDRTTGPQQFADLLRSGHLLLAPERRRAIRRVIRPVRCLPDLSTAITLPQPAQVHLVRLIRSLRLAASLRTRRLADLIALPSPLARLQAVTALLAHDSPEADRAVDRFCFDRAEPVAHLASQQVFGRPGGPGEAMLQRLEHSPHKTIARQAAATLARSNVEAFFQRWMRLSRNDRLAASLGLAATQRETMLARLAAILADGRRQEKLAAITLARQLGLVAKLEAELIAQAAAGDSRVASAAIAALADGGSNRRLDAVGAALRHGDARVRANAIETLSHIDRRATDLFVPVTGSRDNRSRANAVRALLRWQPEAGAERLRVMLADPDPLHRVSAVWVAERARATPVVNDLRRLAEHDRLCEVRTRAAATARLLSHHCTVAKGAV